MRKVVLIVAGVLFLGCFGAEAAIRMASLFTDSMVLQQGMPVPIWGTAASGEHVTVEFGNQKESTTADTNGQWRVTLQKLEADRNQVPQVLKVTGTDPKGGVSAVTINDVLIGEVWICSGQSNMQFPLASVTNAKVEIDEANYPQIRMFSLRMRTAAVPESRCEGRWVVCDPAIKEEPFGRIIGHFSAAGYFFARNLHKDLKVPVGMINSSWGGSPIEPWTSLDALRGTTSACQRVLAFEKSRADYEADRVKFNQMRDEAIQKQADAMAEWTGSIFTNDSERQSRRPNIPIPSIPGSGWDVSTIYNAMIAPLAPYALRGAVWYQGESNADQPLQYAELFPAMISSWRKTWGQKDFDFLFVQLANFMARQQAPIETQSWADIRDSQRLTLADPHAGMAVAIDIGEATDIHPRNKQDVGKRLALWALARTYGKKGFEYSGPLYRSVKIKDNRAMVTFDHAGAGLASRGTPLVGFAVAGEDKIFHVAKAAIEGKTVVVSSDSVAKPVAVRYAWANNPICNLCNKDGLPASSFRTDTWASSEIKAASEPLSEPVPAVDPAVK